MTPGPEVLSDLRVASHEQDWAEIPPFHTTHLPPRTCADTQHSRGGHNSKLLHSFVSHTNTHTVVLTSGNTVTMVIDTNTLCKLKVMLIKIFVSIGVEIIILM